MKCTICDEEFDYINVNGFKMYFCKKCQSVMLSNDVFNAILQAVDPTANSVDITSLPNITVKEASRNCPECDSKMDKLYFDGVIVDKCKTCNNIIFDNGELPKIVDMFVKDKIELMSNFQFINKYLKNASPEIKKNDLPVSHTTGKKTSRSLEKDAPKMEAVIAILLYFCIAVPCVLFSIILGGAWIVLAGVIAVLLALFIIAGFKIIKPQEALVLTLFGNYHGTIKEPGFFWVNPFATSALAYGLSASTLSLKVRTLDNPKQKINDAMGNPIEVGIMVTWEVTDTFKAVFNVDEYESFLSAQCDSALRNIVRMYAYDAPDEDEKVTLRGDSAEISTKLKAEIQSYAQDAGINIIDAKITHLAYSEEIASVMLQRQQAGAILDAKKVIVEGAVGMVELAIDKLSQNKNLILDEKTKANMVNNMLVVLCGNKESQPVIRNDKI